MYFNVFYNFLFCFFLSFLNAKFVIAELEEIPIAVLDYIIWTHSNYVRIIESETP